MRHPGLRCLFVFVSASTMLAGMVTATLAEGPAPVPQPPKGVVAKPLAAPSVVPVATQTPTCAPSLADPSKTKSAEVKATPAFFGSDVSILVKNVQCLVTHAHRDKLRLFVDGRVVAGARPAQLAESSPADDKASHVWFPLAWPAGTDAASKADRAVLRRLLDGKPVQLGIGLDGQAAYVEGPFTLELGWHQRYAWVAAFAVFVGLVALIGWTAPQPSPPSRNSLSRLQMLWWTAIVVTSVVYVWGHTGQISVSNDALVLLGIAALVRVGAKQVDKVKEHANVARAADAVRSANALMGAAAAANSSALAAPASRAAIQRSANELSNAATAELARAAQLGRNAQPAPPTGNVLRDILEDSDGLAVHRLQILLFTLVVGIYYIHQVWTTLSEPALEPTVLALIGISGGAYVTLKYPETRS